jgi:hypothetical protein
MIGINTYQRSFIVLRKLDDGYYEVAQQFTI